MKKSNGYDTLSNINFCEFHQIFNFQPEVVCVAFKKSQQCAPLSLHNMTLKSLDTVLQILCTDLSPPLTYFYRYPPAKPHFMPS